MKIAGLRRGHSCALFKTLWLGGLMAAAALGALGCYPQVIIQQAPPAPLVAAPPAPPISDVIKLATPVTDSARRQGQDQANTLAARGWTPPKAGTLTAQDAKNLRWTLEGPARHTKLDRPVPMSAVQLASVRQVHTQPGQVPRLKLSHNGQLFNLPLEHTHVKAELSGAVARVEVTQRYTNPMAEPIESVYIFPLPENSAVDGMHMTIGARRVVANIERRAAARERYEAARRRGQTAALLEQERPNIFTQSVANIAPGQTIEVTIQYVQELTQDGGESEFVFPMVVGPRFFPGEVSAGANGAGWRPDTDEVPDASRISPPVVGAGMRTGHDISLELVAYTGLPAYDLDTPTHKVQQLHHDQRGFSLKLDPADKLPNRDFVLRYRVDQAQTAISALAHKKKGQEGTVAVQIQPPTVDLEAEVGHREVVFVVDVSGSMRGVPLAMSKDVMRRALGMLRPTDRFNVVTFARGTRRIFKHSRPANAQNLRRATEIMGSFGAGGSTNMGNAVTEVLSEPVDEAYHRYVLFLTDGFVGNESQIASKVSAFVHNNTAGGRKARVFGLGIGSSTNRSLIESLSTAGDGLSHYIVSRKDLPTAVDKVFRTIDSPIMTDVTVTFKVPGVHDLTLNGPTTLFASRAMTVYGRYRWPAKGKVIVKGQVGGRPVTLSKAIKLPGYEKSNSALGTLWARARIGALERSLWDGLQQREVQQIIEKITQTALNHHLVTAYTSFVAVDEHVIVGDGNPKRVVQPVEAPEGVDPVAAGAPVIAGPRVDPSTNRIHGLEKVDRGSPAKRAAPAPNARGGQSFGRSHGHGMTDSFGASNSASNNGAKAAAGASAAHAPSSAPSNRDKLKRDIHHKAKRIRVCFDRILEIDPQAKGRINLRLHIEPSGTVSKVEILRNDFSQWPLMEACVLATYRNTHLRSFKGEPMQIMLPLRFAP